ncbi:dihydropteroate synthase [Promethearchaeum syntrophicum]|uniref:dihydropteroate synthase n=1 Tax=Promethearchaeum syntrophicum TaxID=2594042 RepID=A0A5B9DB79_9ARCH|nr:dihydropteroate synthase [Candidatus Prometheoarchaeum syntrophicum]QEE16374.1 dihydropteroate synthase [Candidatus Prometheoarchaeum syntrophicum]
MGIINNELFPGYSIGDFNPVRIMGVINLSPESFHKNSFVPNDSLIEKLKNFIKNGASIIDIGARSTAPWSDVISVEEEKKRILNALNLLSKHFPKDIILSFDTQYAEIAKLGLEFAKKNEIRSIINDISSFKTDPKMIDIICEYGCPIVLMATENKPGDRKSIDEILKALHATITQLRDKGYDTSKVIVDPGIGKWISEKTYEYDLAILDSIESFRCFRNPILIGLSRKSFIGSILDESDTDKREIGSLAATSIAVYNGAHIIRTHDVDQKVKQTIKVATSIRKKPIISKADSHICEIIDPFTNPLGADYFLRSYGVFPGGSKIMNQKMINKLIVLHNITAPAALILKQELLSRGGDAATHSQVISTEWKKTEEIFDVVLIGTIGQFKSLIKKLKGQHLKLDIIASLIENTLKKEKEAKIRYSKTFEGYSK